MSGLSWLRAAPDGVELHLKVVPGASRSAVTGVLGDRLKLRIAAPPEDGRANRAVEDMLGTLTGRRCTVIAGHTGPMKSILVAGGVLAAVRAAIMPD